MPTREQLLAVERAANGEDLVVFAFAGAGKTSTLRLMAERMARPSLYLAYNAEIARVARADFPPNVEARTIHSVAHRALRYNYDVAKLSTRPTPNALAALLRNEPRLFGRGPLPVRLDPIQRATLILDAVRAFCYSDDGAITAAHVSLATRRFAHLGDQRRALSEAVADAARRCWAGMSDRHHPLPLGHDGYLKLWALGQPDLGMSVIYLDEAQDTNPVVLGVLRRQGAQKIIVGDQYQQIYEWRGAVDAMARFDCQRAYLTQSFRFGPAIARAASGVLRTLGEARPLVGNPAVDSTIVAEAPVQAVIARTNLMVVEALMTGQRDGHRVHLVGGKTEPLAILRDVQALQAGRPVFGGDLAGYRNWHDVERASRTEEGRALRTSVALVRNYGVRALMAAVEASEDNERAAGLVVTTAHKAKGREWPSVRIEPDFVRTRDGQVSPAEIRLFYVAITRARHTLVVPPALWREFGVEP